MTKRRVLIIYTGGTIGMVKDYETKALRAFDFSKISERIPELNHLDCHIQTESFENVIDSSNVSLSDMVKIGTIIFENFDSFDGFVVLTGSDTMAYISSTLSFMLENLSKPVIFTGSQLPIGDLRTDAKENLITAIQVASAYKNNLPIVSEVCLYFEYKLYRANRTSKVNAEHFEAFTSPNYPPLAESGVHLNFNSHLLHKTKESDAPLILRTNLNPNVFVLKLFPGMGREMLEHVFSIPGLRAIVMETYGAGNAPSESWFTSVLSEAIESGIKIVNITQCNAGSVIQGHYETSLALQEMGVIEGRDLTTEAALAKLMYLLALEDQLENFKSVFETPLRGEMTAGD
jgi:L-asparaginase